ncbi:MAG TPA: hypothetical protein VF101_09155 [Gaiellaceae bacterium]
MAKKTVFVSDLTGEPIDDRNYVQVVLNYHDARRGRVVLDANAEDIEDLARRGQKQARRGRKPKET